MISPFFFLFSFRDPALRDHAMLWLWIGESRGDCIVGMGVAGRHGNGELKEEEEEEEEEEGRRRGKGKMWKPKRAIALFHFLLLRV